MSPKNSRIKRVGGKGRKTLLIYSLDICFETDLTAQSRLTMNL